MVSDKTSRRLQLVHPAPDGGSERQVATTVTLARELVPVGRVVLAHYVCAEGHGNRLPFAVSEHTPVEWDCRCGLVGRLELPDIEIPAPISRADRAPSRRSHWDRVRGRRTMAELQALLDERVVALRAADTAERVTRIGTWHGPDRMAQ